MPPLPIATAAYTSRGLRPYHPTPLRATVFPGQGRGARGEHAAAGTASGVRGAWPWYRRLGRGPASEAVSREMAMSRVMRTAAALVYPSADDRPMAESDGQLGAMLYLLTALRIRYRDRADVFVGGDLFMYYEEGNPAAAVAPDVMVVLGAAKRAGNPRKSYKLWEEPKGPDFVLEVASRSTWAVDRDEKRAVYASLGVEEYWLYDPTGEQLTARLRGTRLIGGGYRELAQTAPVSGSARYASSPGARTVRSTVLGLDVCVERGGALCLFNPVTGQALPGYEEEHVARKAEVVARRAAEVRLERETAARKAAEARVSELEALVQELRSGRTRPGGNE